MCILLCAFIGAHPVGCGLVRPLAAWRTGNTGKYERFFVVIEFLSRF
jgi:hypothetical protein